MTLIQILNTTGVARRLGGSEAWAQKLASARKLKASIYDDNGILVERKLDSKRQEHGVCFFWLRGYLPPSSPAAPTRR